MASGVIGVASGTYWALTGHRPANTPTGISIVLPRHSLSSGGWPLVTRRFKEKPPWRILGPSIYYCFRARTHHRDHQEIEDRLPQDEDSTGLQLLFGALGCGDSVREVHRQAAKPG